MNKRDFIFKDIGFVVRATWSEAHWIDWTVIEILGEDTNGVLVFTDNPDSINPTEDINKAPIFMQGFLKWDGCMEFKFTEQEHICGREDAANIGELFQRIYDIGMELMPQHTEYLKRAN